MGVHVLPRSVDTSVPDGPTAIIFVASSGRYAATERKPLSPLTSVHVNRVLQALRSEGPIRTQGKQIWIEDWQALCAAGDFDADYLHLRAEAIPADLQEGAPVRSTQGLGTRL